MKKALIGLFLAGLILWAGYHGLVRYGAHQMLHQVAEDWNSKGDLHWGSVRSTLNGQIRVHDLRWHWFDITQPVTVEAIELSLAGPGDLLRLLRDGDWPREWTLDLSELELQLEPDLFRPWARARPSRFLAQPPFALTACGQRAVLSPADFLQLGIDRIEADLTFAYRVPENDAVGFLDVRLDAGALGRANGRLFMPASALPLPASGQSLAVPDAMELTIRDDGFMRRVASFCAAREDKTREDWARISAERWAQAMQAEGWEPTESLTALYRLWLSEGGTLAVDWHPDPERQLQAGEAMSAAEWQQAQGLDVRYNDNPVPEAAIALSGAPSPEPPPPVEVQDPALDMTARFFESDVERAAAWIDRRVQVTLPDGRSLEGQLASYDEDALYLRRRIAGGEMVVPVPLAAIDTFAVWRRADDPGRPVVEEPADPQDSAVFAPWLDEAVPGSESDDREAR